MHKRNMKPVNRERIGKEGQKGRQAHCGPTAMAALIDVDTHKIYKKILTDRRKRHLEWSEQKFGRIMPVDRKIAKRMYIKGTSSSELCQIVRHYRKNDRMIRIFPSDRAYAPPETRFRTLEDWIVLPSSAGGPKDGVGYLVCIMNHWVAVKNDEILDTFSHGIPLKFHSHPLVNRKVKEIYEITTRI